MSSNIDLLTARHSEMRHSIKVEPTKLEGHVVPVFLANSGSGNSSFNLQRGKLSWEITYNKTSTYDPDSFKILLWNIALLVFVLYDAWVVPLLLCFDVINSDMCNQTWPATTAYAFEVAFLGDVYVQMHMGYYLYGNLVRNTASTRLRYLYSWNLPLDVMALIPLSFFPSVTKHTCGLGLVNKLLRLRRLQSFSLNFDKVFARYFIACKVVKVVVVTYMFTHVMACVYVSFGQAGDNDGVVWKLEVEAGHDHLLAEYFAALFWAIGLVSKCTDGEIPHTLWETVFTLVVMLGGFLLFVYICGTLFMISKCDANSAERFDAKLKQLRHVLSFHNVPSEIQQRAIEYLEQEFKSGDANDRHAMKLLCPSIAKDLKFTLLKTMVSSVPFFKCCNAAFIRALIDLMEPQSLPTNFIVCNVGDREEDMYFVQSGVLIVMLNGVNVRELRKGGFFGELSLFSNQVRPTSDLMEQMKGMDPHFEKASGIFLDNMSIRLFGQEETIYRKGDYADTLSILLVGNVSLIANIRSSKPLPLRYVKQGEIFGCSCLQIEKDSVVHAENAIARSACVVVLVERSALFAINEEFPSFCTNLQRKEQKILIEHRAMLRLLEQTELAAMKMNKDSGTIDPDSSILVLWETFLFVSIVSQITTVPYYMAFGFASNSIGMYDYLSIVFEISFAVDIFLKTKTDYYEYGNKVRERTKILYRYLRSFNFAIDILSLLPINLINIFKPHRSEVWNMNKLLRLFKLSSQIEHLERHYYTLNIQIRILKLVFYVYLLAHYIGCTWYNFASNESSFFGFTEDPQFGYDEWLPNKEIDVSKKDVTAAFKYTRVLYWGLGLLLGINKGGYPTTPLEYSFTILVQTVGVFLLAYVIGNLLDSVQVMDGNNRLFYSNLNYVRKLTKYFKFSSDIKQKIQHFYFYRLFHSIHQEHVLIKSLPPSLVTDIRVFLLTPMLKKVPFFQNETAGSNVTRSLVRHLSQVLVTRHEMVCRQNEVGEEMFFVFTGCLDVYVVSEQGPHGAHHDAHMETVYKGVKVGDIHAGSFFGEKSLFSDQPRNASIEAKTFCTLYRLSRKHLQSVFGQHPEWRSKVMQIVSAIYETQARVQLVKQNSDTKGILPEKSIRNHSGRSLERVRSGGQSLRNISSVNTEDDGGVGVVVVPWTMRTKQALLTIDVQSRVYRVHLFLLALSLFYIALSVPYFLTFGHAKKTTISSVIVKVLDIFADIVFIFDIWLKSHIVETVASREFYEHMRQPQSSDIFLDVMTVLPLDYVMTSFIANDTVLRFNRIIKLRQLTYTVNEIHRFSMSYEVNRLKLLAIFYFIVGYWTACGYFGLTFVVGFSEDWDSSLPVEYFNPHNHEDNADVIFSLHQFLRCLYFSAKMFTGIGLVHEPHTSLEFAYIFVMSVFGAFAMAYAIGEGSSLFIYLIQNEVNFKINQMKVMDFLARKHVDASLRNRVNNYLAYWWAFQEGVTHQSTFDQLPRRIRAQAFIEIAHKSISSFALRYIRPLIQHTPTSLAQVVHSIAHRLVFEGYPAGESVIVQGNIGHMMYFVSSGTLISASTNSKFVTTRFEEGQFFGEEGFLSATFCRYSVVSLRACDLLALKAADFLSALDEHTRTSECCLVARGFATRYAGSVASIKSNGSSIGQDICSIIDSKSSKLYLLKHLTPDAAEVMFSAFLRLFVLEDITSTCFESNAIDVCQHCEDRPATLYCKQCLQGLCETCSTFIHQGKYFCSHLASIERVETEPMQPSRKRRGSFQFVVDTFLRRHRVAAVSPSHDSSTTALDSSSSFLAPHKRLLKKSPQAQSDAAVRLLSLAKEVPTHDGTPPTIPKDGSSRVIHITSHMLSGASESEHSVPFSPTLEASFKSNKQKPKPRLSLFHSQSFQTFNGLTHHRSSTKLSLRQHSPNSNREVSFSSDRLVQLKADSPDRRPSPEVQQILNLVTGSDDTLTSISSAPSQASAREVLERLDAVVETASVRDTGGAELDNTENDVGDDSSSSDNGESEYNQVGETGPTQTLVHNSTSRQIVAPLAKGTDCFKE
ncbi:Aste57867_22656 [Aphanomyces stellatus]|uniref:Aste57867_22656 protein n=1 Tax=Aphanomyces stellatus TaxID=120398 RepID=A0A485LKS7_9STRA|nr:hypothetical protein As57867_022586 [Aphanomyces stellatus]VFT99310.1 Aste57867_22656 [Aphanomyces stellatus]